MKNKLNFQELLLKYMKKNKQQTNRQVTVLAMLLAIFFIVTSLFGSNFTKNKEIAVQAESDTITLGITGDMMLGRFVEKTTERYGTDSLFAGTGIDLTSLDYLTGNFEHPVINDSIKLEDQEREKIYLSTDEEAVDIVKKAGFTSVNLANNHMYDYDEEGLLYTLETFRQKDMPFVGAGENRSEAYRIHYEEIQGIRIATLGFSEIYTRSALTGIDTPGIATSNIKIMLNKIDEARKFSDVVITHIHWGTEYKTKPDKRQKEIAEILAEAGVDIIIGHHPHVLQPIDVIDQTIVFYSLGNFVFDQGWSMTRETVFPILKLNQNGEINVELNPLLIKEGFPQQLKTSEHYYKNRIFNRVKRNSSIDFVEKDGKLYFQTRLQSESVKQ